MYQFIQAHSLEQALTLRREHPDFWLVAGATDVWPKLRHAKHKPAGFLDLSRVDLNSWHSEADGSLYLGSLVTAAQLESWSDDLQAWSLLIDAAKHVGSPQIRNRATLAGNVATASPCADMTLAMLCLNARVVVSSLEMERAIALEDFLLGPGKTDLKPTEIITGFIIPAPSKTATSFYRKCGARKALVIAIASMAAHYDFSDNGFSRIQLSFGSVAPTTIRAYKTEQVLQSGELCDDLLDWACHTLQQEITPISDHRASEQYRRQVSQNYLRELIEGLLP